MALIGSPDTDYTIRVVIKETSYTNKDSAVDNMRYPIHIPMGAVNVSMFQVICLCISHFALPKSISPENFVLYIYGEIFILPLHLNYICVCIDMFVNIIMVSVFLCLCILYYLIVGYTSSWYFVLYLPCAWVVPPLSHWYICVGITLVLNVISMVTAICLCT